MGESPRSKKNPQTGGGCSIFSSIALFFFFSFAHSFFVIFDQVLPVRVCVGGRAGSISETGLSLSLCVSAGVFSAGDVEFSLCVLECGN